MDTNLLYAAVVVGMGVADGLQLQNVKSDVLLMVIPIYFYFYSFKTHFVETNDNFLMTYV